MIVEHQATAAVVVEAAESIISVSAAEVVDLLILVPAAEVV